jgi:hypothetical protein
MWLAATPRTPVVRDVVDHPVSYRILHGYAGCPKAWSLRAHEQVGRETGCLRNLRHVGAALDVATKWLAKGNTSDRLHVGLTELPSTRGRRPTVAVLDPMSWYSLVALRILQLTLMGFR